MSLFTIFIATGMFAYWIVRGWLVVLGPEEQVVRRLQEDEWLIRRLRLLLFGGLELSGF